MENSKAQGSSGEALGRLLKGTSKVDGFSTLGAGGLRRVDRNILQRNVMTSGGNRNESGNERKVSSSGCSGASLLG